MCDCPASTSLCRCDNTPEAGQTGASIACSAYLRSTIACANKRCSIGWSPSSSRYSMIGEGDRRRMRCARSGKRSKAGRSGSWTHHIVGWPVVERAHACRVAAEAVFGERINLAHRVSARPGPAGAISRWLSLTRSTTIRIHWSKSTIFSLDCRTINSHEGQEAYSQTGTRRALSDLWRGARQEVRTHNRTAPYNAAS